MERLVEEQTIALFRRLLSEETGGKALLPVCAGPFVKGMYEDVHTSRETRVRTRILLLTAYISRLQDN